MNSDKKQNNESVLNLAISLDLEGIIRKNIQEANQQEEIYWNKPQYLSTRDLSSFVLGRYKNQKIIIQQKIFRKLNVNFQQIKVIYQPSLTGFKKPYNVIGRFFKQIQLVNIQKVRLNFLFQEDDLQNSRTTINDIINDNHIQFLVQQGNKNSKNKVNPYMKQENTRKLLYGVTERFYVIVCTLKPMNQRVVIKNKIGECLMCLGKWKEAISICYDKMLQIDPQNYPIHLIKANILFQQKQLPEALQVYNIALQLNSSDFLIHFQKGNYIQYLGLVLLLLNEYEQALKVFDHIIKQQPLFFDAFYYKGKALIGIAMKIRPMLRLDCFHRPILKAKSKNGNNLDYDDPYRILVQACECFDRAIQINSQKSISHKQKGYVLSLLDQNEEAITPLETAIELNSTDDETYIRIAETLCRMKRYNEAFLQLNLIQQRNKSNFESHYIEGMALKEQKQYLYANECLNKAITLQENHYYANLEKGNCLRKLKNYIEALGCYEKALNIDPSSFKGHYKTGLTLDNLGKHQEALVNYDVALKLKPDERDLIYEKKGKSLIQLGDAEEAIRRDRHFRRQEIQFLVLNHLDSCIEIGYSGQTLDDIEIQEEQQEMIGRLGRYEEALKQLQNVRLNSPRFLGVKEIMATILIQLKRYDEAIQMYKQIIEINPSQKHLIQIGNTLIAWGKYQEAFDYYKTLIQQNSHNTTTFFISLGEILALQGNYKEAIQVYDQVIWMEPMQEDIYLKKGQILRLIDGEDRNSELNLINHRIMNILIEFSKKLKELVDNEDYQKAIELCEKQNCDNYQIFWITQQKGNKEMELLARLLRKLHLYEESISCLDQWMQNILQNHKSNKENYFQCIIIHIEIGISLCKQNQYQKAIRNFDSALTAQPNNCQALKNKGFALTKLFKFEEALQLLDQSTRLNPHDSEGFNIKGLFQQYQGLTLLCMKKERQAIFCFDQSIQLSNNFEAWYNKGFLHFNLGMAHLQIQQYEDAYLSFNQAILIDPKFPSAQTQREQVLILINKNKD